MVKVTAQSMASRQVPRHIGDHVCEFRGVGVLPVVHWQFLDMKARRYSHIARAGLASSRVQDQLRAFETSGGLAAVQVDRGGPEDLSFKNWWGILRFTNFHVSDEAEISFDVIGRLTDWPAN